MVRNALADPYAETELWWEPIQLDSSNDGPVLTEAQVQQWLRDVRPHPTPPAAGPLASGAQLTLGCVRARRGSCPSPGSGRRS